MSITETLKYHRQNKKSRLIFLGGLILVIIALLFFWGKAKGLLITLLIITLLTFGVELFDYDIDLGRLWKTGSITESRVENKNGMRIFGEECITNNLNCSNFATQPEAQALYESCAQKIALDNDTSTEALKNIDVYGLDRDKDGVVCEALKTN